MSEVKSIEIPIAGMDCAECTQHVRHAIAALPGVESVEVYLAAEKAALRIDPTRVSLDAIRQAVKDAGYSVPDVPGRAGKAATSRPGLTQGGDFARQVSALLAFFFGAVLFVVVVGEWLGLFEQLTERVPWPVGLAIVLVGGWPVFLNVVRATLRRQIISHTLMTLGVIAALAVGQWATAAVVVFFMRVGDYVEKFTAERSRRALKDLTELMPQTARVERDGQEAEIPAADLVPGEIVIVRPGEQIPADGEVVAGRATVDQAAITGEPLPVEVGPGSRVYAATIAQLGSLRVRVEHAGTDSTFGRVVRLVAEAEANRGPVQRMADRFSGYYLPVVLGIAVLTFLLRRDPLATAAVLVVACSCSFALATPIAMLASIGAAARRGLLIKGGRVLETLARADVLLIDKTGTVTLGKPRIVEIADCGSQIADLPISQSDILRLAASAERYSEHPLAEAVRAAARERGIALAEPEDFRAEPGMGVSAVVDGALVKVGNLDWTQGFSRSDGQGEQPTDPEGSLRTTSNPVPQANDRTRGFSRSEGQGEQPADPEGGLRTASIPELREAATLLYVSVNGQLAGALVAADTLRPEVPAALARVREFGIRHVELLTGDNEQAAAALAERLGVPYRAGLLPEDKIRIVRDYQARGHTVIMVGDGVNDAAALAQADVGIAMAAAGSDIAIEAAHIALLRDDWKLVPELLRVARRTMGVVRMNLGFTALYNLAGLTLAAFGILPPILAAAAQSLPDLGILGNSARLLRDT
ncbi:MAG: cation-translocating P-type ATPase [Anaerolineae bacterium]|nr:cation-translocating P-type ATPase [Anaerolineae bacterium]